MADMEGTAMSTLSLVLVILLILVLLGGLGGPAIYPNSGYPAMAMAWATAALASSGFS